MKPWARFAVLLAFLNLTGCAAHLGPQSIRQSHRPYNDSVIESLNEQLLLNLVRLKYRDNPYFIEVSSITSQSTFEGSVGVGGFFPFQGARAGSLTPAVSALYADNPVVSYQPLQGEAFIQKVMAPIPMEALMQLSQSGWSISRVMRIAVEQANHLHNAPSASGPTPTMAPEYEAFLGMALELRRLQQTQGIDLVLEGNSIAMTFDPSRISSAETRALRGALGLHPSGESIVLTVRPQRTRRVNELFLQTRSLAGALFFLSHNIDVPPAHQREGLVTTTLSADGTPFDWNRVSGDLLKVHSSAAPPRGDFVSVHYRGHYFYIADNDLDSKSTFMLLNQLFNLLAGDVKKSAPVLTIPVGG
jgi:hypothetical protein